MRFMVSTGFQGPADEMNDLIPQEQAHIKVLREQGIVEALYISSDHPLVWMVMQGESKEFIQQTLQSLPLYPYMQPEIMTLL